MCGIAGYITAEPSLPQRGFSALDLLLERHTRGVEDATDRIRRLLNLQVWGDLFVTGKQEQRWEG